MTELDEKALATLDRLLAIVADPAAAQKTLSALRETKALKAQLADDRAQFEEFRLRAVTELEKGQRLLAQKMEMLARSENHPAVAADVIAMAARLVARSPGLTPN